MFLKNEKSLGVKNGTLGTVERIGGGALQVRLDGEEKTRIVVETRDYPEFDHGYASTVHKSQGATVDRTYVLRRAGTLIGTRVTWHSRGTAKRPRSSTARKNLRLPARPGRHPIRWRRSSSSPPPCRGRGRRSWHTITWSLMSLAACWKHRPLNHLRPFRRGRAKHGALTGRARVITPLRRSGPRPSNAGTRCDRGLSKPRDGELTRNQPAKHQDQIHEKKHGQSL